MVRRILVVTEGTCTEPQYVEGLNDYLRHQGVTAMVKRVPVGKDPLKVVKKCIEVRNDAAARDREYDICVCLVDVDQHQTLPAACRLAAEENVFVIVSNLKFEVWLRWHVEDRCSVLSTIELDDLMGKMGLTVGKNLSSTFPFPAVDRACATARRADPDLKAGRVGPDPSTAMPVLVDLMRGGDG
ncbi:RloB family protein [Arachnia propionica]|uniref:RloB family protein n=1 Tax=Arachnia propionica TaxID=1750 RepID=UPI00163956C6|nr:RloB family protein [Arachnia propionica]